MPSFRVRASRLLLLGLALALAGPVPASTFTTSPELSREAKTLVRLLEDMHYNRDAIKTRDYLELVPDYMGELDGQRLFFLASDKAAFTSRYNQTLYYNIRDVGNVDAAYEIFTVYQARVKSRVDWIDAELKKDFDLTTHETCLRDRSKVEWPATPAEADELWHRELKLDILTEVLNKKSVAQAKEIVRKRYERMLKNINETDAEDLAEYFLSCVTQLYDPHSTYFSADDYEDFNIQMRLSLIGIGAMLDIKDDYCLVREIVPGSPAALNKQLQPDDKIISVAQTGGEPVDVIGMKLHRIVNLIRGPKGTQVHLTVIPANATDPSTRKEIILTRDVVKLNSARAHAAIFAVPSADGKSTTPIGVISLPSFYGPTDSDDSQEENTSATKDVAKLINQLQAAGIKGLVLDLRHNGGGLLSEAVTIAGLFIGHGPVVQVRDYQGEIKVDDDNEESSIAYAGPMAVLVDRFSASASEIVAGALQDYGRAIVIGDDSTHGKGTVQTLVEMKALIPQLDNSDLKAGAAKITFQKFYLPDGSSTQLRGVVSDISLPSIDDYLPIGEKDLPHALVWDEIPTTVFDGGRLDPKILKPLRDASLARQQKLAEFAFLNKGIAWFKTKEEEKRISLNLMEREQEKAADDAFDKEMKLEKNLLAKNDFKYREFRLGPPLPPTPPQKKTDDMDDDTDLDADENETYVPLDIPLRESLRIVTDALALSQDHLLWTDNHAPLTALVDDKS
jgi:carboxyl-terminal processing protease